MKPFCTFEPLKQLQTKNYTEMTTLNFGKFKGQKFQDTPEWYQKWLLSQPWFNKQSNEKPLHQQLNGWDGFSRKGQAIYDAIFEQEKQQGEMLDKISGMYEPGGMYYGI